MGVACTGLSGNKKSLCVVWSRVNPSAIGCMSVNFPKYSSPWVAAVNWSTHQTLTTYYCMFTMGRNKSKLYNPYIKVRVSHSLEEVIQILEKGLHGHICIWMYLGMSDHDLKSFACTNSPEVIDCLLIIVLLYWYLPSCCITMSTDCT